VQHGLVPSRIEPIADLAERDEAVLGEHRVELVSHRFERAGQIPVLPRAFDVVQHWQQISEYPARGQLAGERPCAFNSSCPMGQVCGAVTPYVILGLIMLLLVAFIPALATWLHLGLDLPQL
jgi:hypothetical protein